MEKQKRKNDEPEVSLSPVFRHSIWVFLLFSHLTWFCAMFTCHDAPYYGDYYRSLYCNYKVEWQQNDILITSVIVLLIWYLLEDWVARPGRRAAIRGLIVAYLFPGRWLMMMIMAQIMVVRFPIP